MRLTPPVLIRGGGDEKNGKGDESGVRERRYSRGQRPMQYMCGGSTNCRASQVGLPGNCVQRESVALENPAATRTGALPSVQFKQVPNPAANVPSGAVPVQIPFVTTGLPAASKIPTGLSSIPSVSSASDVAMTMVGAEARTYAPPPGTAILFLAFSMGPGPLSSVESQATTGRCPG